MRSVDGMDAKLTKETNFLSRPCEDVNVEGFRILVRDEAPEDCATDVAFMALGTHQVVQGRQNTGVQNAIQIFGIGILTGCPGEEYVQFRH